MYFSKSVSDDTNDYAKALSDARSSGYEILGTVTEREGEHHILAKDKDGRRMRIYFDGAPTVAKADVPLAKAEEEAKVVLAAIAAKSEAAEVRKNEDKIDAVTFNQLVKAVQQRTQCGPRDAHMAVTMALQNGTLIKALGGYGAQLAMRGPQTNAGYRAAVEKASTAPRGSRVNALRQAYLENPDAFA